MTRTANDRSTTAVLPDANRWGNHLRGEFPILSRTVHGKPLVYLDNAATTQKPKSVIDVNQFFYSRFNANIHRGVHQLSQDATEAYEDARGRVGAFLGADEARQIVFTRGATEAINLVAHSYAGQVLEAGDEVILSEMEHHSNIVPWQQVCKQRGAHLRVIPIDDTCDLRLDRYHELLGPKTKIVAVTQMSNVLGVVNPVKQMIKLAHQHGAVVLVDGAQAVAHLDVDVAEMDCDFFVMSGHKLYGPTGIGVLYGKTELLEKMPPYQSGGDMVDTVRFEETTFAEIPGKFEAGTPNISGAIGLSVAIDYLSDLDTPSIHRHEAELLEYAKSRLGLVPGLQLIGTPQKQSAVLSFTIDGIHPHDLGTVLDQQGVAIRTGHHCAQPLMERLGVSATSRISLALYNTREDIDAAVFAIDKAKELFRC